MNKNISLCFHAPTYTGHVFDLSKEILSKFDLWDFVIPGDLALYGTGWNEIFDFSINDFKDVEAAFTKKTHLSLHHASFMRGSTYFGVSSIIPKESDIPEELKKELIERYKNDPEACRAAAEAMGPFGQFVQIVPGSQRMTMHFTFKVEELVQKGITQQQMISWFPWIIERFSPESIVIYQGVNYQTRLDINRAWMGNPRFFWFEEKLRFTCAPVNWISGEFMAPLINNKEIWNEYLQALNSLDITGKEILGGLFIDFGVEVGMTDKNDLFTLQEEIIHLTRTYFQKALPPQVSSPQRSPLRLIK